MLFIIEGVSYDSATEASKELGVSRQTIYRRCESEIHTGYSFGFVSFDKSNGLMADGKYYKNIKSAMKELNLSYSCVNGRLNNNMNVDFMYICDLPDGIYVNGVHYYTLGVVAKTLSVSNVTVHNRCNKGTYVRVLNGKVKYD